LVIEPSDKAQFKMRIFNSDGSEAEMCGNGSRCVGLWSKKNIVTFETKAGIIETRLKNGNTVKARFTDPHGLKTDICIDVFSRSVKVNFLNTGVPHVVVFVDALKEIDVKEIGRELRFHKYFSPAGSNVNFVQVLDKDLIEIRTYERGVEDETMACGTGTVASAVIYGLKVGSQGPVSVINQSKEATKVYFDRIGESVENVWLEGKAYLTFKGELEV
jgi:diaminopimelate epimerase